MPLRQELHLGLDFGTSKIAVAWFSRTSEDWQELLVSDVGVPLAHTYEKYVEPSQVAISLDQTEPLFGRGAYEASLNTQLVTIESVKKCVYCEWVLQPSRTVINEDDCVNRKNFGKSKWCDHGRLQFTLNSYDWRPTVLFHMLLDYTFRKVRKLLDDRFGRKGYSINELKLAYPMIFSRAGRIHEERLTATVRSVVTPILRDVANSNFEVLVVEEPVASLMAFGGDMAAKAIGNGFFLVVDVGAGSTDVALCQKARGRIVIHHHDSQFIAGDDYDRAILQLLAAKVGMDYDFDPRPRVIKERYCESPQRIVVNCLDRTSGAVATSTDLDPSEVEESFGGLNAKIGNMVEQMKAKAEEQNRQIRDVYLTGGGSSVGSLVDSIEKAVMPASVVPIRLADPQAQRNYDARIVSVSMGAAFPRNKYAEVLKYSLPVNLLIRVGPVGDERERTLYDCSRTPPEPDGMLDIPNVPDGSRLKLFVEDREGNRRILTSVNVPDGCRKAQVKYEVAFNGCTRISLKTKGRQPWRVIYEDYPHWKR